MFLKFCVAACEFVCYFSCCVQNSILWMFGVLSVLWKDSLGQYWFFFIFSILQHLLFLFLGLCWRTFGQVHGDLSVHTDRVPSSVGPPSMIVRSSHSMVSGQVTFHIPHERDSLGHMPRNKNTGFLRWLNWLLSPRHHGRIPAHVFQNLKMFETQL